MITISILERKGRWRWLRINKLTRALGGDGALSSPGSPIVLGRTRLSKEVEVPDPSNRHWFPYLFLRICQCQSEQAKTYNK